MSPENDMSVLEDYVRKQELEKQSAQHVASARCRMILRKDPGSVFFATLALRLKAEPSWEIDTVATDGKLLQYNPSFVLKLGHEDMVGVVAHEVLHNALGHHARQGHREKKRWNIAADLAVNPLLITAGFSLPKERLEPGKGEYAHMPDGLSAEEYYSLLEQPGGDEEGDDGEGEEEGKGDSDDPGQCGGVKPPQDGSQAACKESQAEWEVATAQAQQIAQQRGQLPAGLGRMVEQLLQPKVDWKEVLREFISRFAKNDYAWSPPNRRFIHLGLYLPGLRSEELGDIIVAVDTSGSIGGPVLARFAGELQGILESFDVSLTILYHDSDITNVQLWKSSDGDLVLEPKGGGGTSHVPVFDWVRENAVDPPACMVCLTDMCSYFPEQAPEYPVLWAVVGNPNPVAPFGTAVEVE